MVKDKRIFDYFTESVDYPDNICIDILPWDVCWCYVSSTFLNGFINYGVPAAFIVLDRYNKDNKKAIDKMLNENFVHSDLHEIGDDVMILLEIGRGKWMFFWYDCDVSDCCIGRFQSDDSFNDIASSIILFLNGCVEDSKSDITGYTVIPKENLRGWISF